jgi:hypothetical protein
MQHGAAGLKAEHAADNYAAAALLHGELIRFEF